MSQKRIHIALESLGLSSLWQYFPTDRDRNSQEMYEKTHFVDYEQGRELFITHVVLEHLLSLLFLLLLGL